MRRARLTPAMAGALIGAFIVGGIVGVVGYTQTQSQTTLRASETVAEAPVATVEQPPSGPLRVVASTVQYPVGYESRRVNGGPTFTFVDLGRIEVESGGKRTIYQAGAFYYEEAGRLYTIRVLEPAQLSTVRLLPPGVGATTEVR